MPGAVSGGGCVVPCVPPATQLILPPAFTATVKFQFPKKVLQFEIVPITLEMPLSSPVAFPNPLVDLPLCPGLSVSFTARPLEQNSSWQLGKHGFLLHVRADFL